MSEGLWDLRHQAVALDRAAATWTEAGQRLSSAADDVNSAATSVLNVGWEGRSADSYDAHRRRLVADIDAGAELAARAARLLVASAGSVRAAQESLDGSFATLAGIDRSGAGDAVEFRPADEDQQQRVEAATAAAQAIRGDLDAALAGDLTELEELAGSWRPLAERWARSAAGEPSFDVPPDSDQTGVLIVDGVAVVDAASGSDEVTVGVDPETGDAVVTVNGVEHRIPSGMPVEIRSGAGDDTVTVGDDTAVGVTVLAGQGADRVETGVGSDLVVGGTGDDEVTGGGGSDQLFGHAGQDYLDGQAGGDLVDGGLDSDTAYGLDGPDTLSGGEGADYLEGGEHRDEVIGGAGEDVVSGGQGDDTVAGGADQDVLYAGQGVDHVDGGSSTDTSYAQGGDTTSSTVARTVALSDVDQERYVDVQGSEDFQDRIRADLALLAASPNGQEILHGIVDGFDENDPDAVVVIREHRPGDPDHAFVATDREGHDYVLGIEPDFDELRGYTPPSVVLGHELAHVYDHAHDRAGELDGSTDGVRDSELVATGLPYDHDGDDDTDPVIDPEHPVEATENGLRDEFGLDLRPDYQP